MAEEDHLQLLPYRAGIEHVLQIVGSRTALPLMLAKP